MNKFKVGDNVRVVSLDGYLQIGIKSSFVEIGGEYKVVSLNVDSVIIMTSKGNWWIDDSDLELVIADYYKPHDESWWIDFSDIKHFVDKTDRTGTTTTAPRRILLNINITQPDSDNIKTTFDSDSITVDAAREIILILLNEYQ
jgi:hypothetical protein